MERINELLRSSFGEYGVEEFGICRFDAGLMTVRTRAVSRVPQGAKSIITALFPYYTGRFDYRNISRYAMISDYHNAAGEILRKICGKLKSIYPDSNFEHFTDISPFNEVRLAALCGLGFIGRNGQLINSRYGPYVFIGEIVTDMMFEKYSAPNEHSCLNCGKCVRACPSGALSAGEFKMELCRSYITQQKRINGEEAERQIRDGGSIWGCDKCADACPYSKGTEFTLIKEFYRGIYAVISEANLDESLEILPCAYRGKKVLERNLRLIGGNEK